MSNWLEVLKKQLKMDANTQPVPAPLAKPPVYRPYGTITGTMTSTATVPSTTFTSTVNIGQSGMAGNLTFPPVYGVTTQPPNHILQFSNQGTEIVRLETNGKVVWNNGIDIDEAAEAFSKSLRLGAELSAGITKSVKLEMRDSVFKDLINIAKEKGNLTAEDLTYLLEASKIVEKLKGGKG